MGRRNTLIGAVLLGTVVITGGFASVLASPTIAIPAKTQTVRLHRITEYITVRPVSGPAGTEVNVKGYVAGGDQHCFPPRQVIIAWLDAKELRYLGFVPGGIINFTSHIPTEAALGAGQIEAIRLRYFNQCHAQVVAQTPFTVTNGPGIFGFSPRSGPVGATVVIKGIRFTGATNVKFNGTSAVFSVDSDTKISATVPAGASTGPIEVYVPGGTQIQKAISGLDFEVT